MYCYIYIQYAHLDKYTIILLHMNHFVRLCPTKTTGTSIVLETYMMQFDDIRHKWCFVEMQNMNYWETDLGDRLSLL